MPTSELLTPRIRGKLAGLRRTLRGRLAGEGLAWTVLALVAAVFASLAVDYLLHLGRAPRGVLTALAAGTVVWVIWRRLLGPLCVPMRPGDLALLVEGRYAELNDRLISTIQFSRTGAAGASAAMIARTAAQANDRAAGLDFRAVVDRRGLLRAVGPACCAAALLAGFAAWQSDVMRLWAARNLAFADIAWPQDTYLVVAGGPDFTVLRGDDLTVTVRLRPGSVPPPHVVLHARYPSGPSEEKIAPADEAGGTYVKVFAAVSEPFEFYVTGGDDRRDKHRPHRVSLIDPPAVRQAQFTVQYPAYTRRGPRLVDASGGVLSAPVGGRVSVLIQVNKELASAAIVLGAESAQTVEPMRRVPDGEGWAGQFALPAENRAVANALRFRLTDVQGHTNRRGVRFLVQVQPDAAPGVDLAKRGIGAVVTPNAIIPLMIRARDDYGVAALRAIVRAGAKDAAWSAETIANDPPGRRELQTRHDVDFRGRGFKPGTVTRIRVEASDAMPGAFGGPNTGASGTLDFRVVTPEELMTELVRRQKALRLEFVQAIAVQESARARTAAAAEALRAGQIHPETRRRLSTSAALQSNVGAECARTGQTLREILQEMIHNRLGSPEDHEQLRDGIIKPLDALAGPIARLVGSMNATAALRDAGRLRDQAVRIADIQADIRTQMEAILERMQKLQGRQELANQLRMIIRWSENVLKVIEKNRDTELGKEFEPTTQPVEDEDEDEDKE